MASGAAFMPFDSMRAVLSESLSGPDCCVDASSERAAGRTAAVMVVICADAPRASIIHAKAYPERDTTYLPGPGASSATAAAGPMVILTSKSQNLSMHAGEIAFPGGKVDDCDRTLLDTAIRETWEETRLRVSRGSVLGRLACVRTRNTGYEITPFVAMLDAGCMPQMRPNSEVDEILAVPLCPVLGTFHSDMDPAHDPVRGMYAFDFGDARGRTVWGATALILKQLYDILCVPT